MFLRDLKKLRFSQFRSTEARFAPYTAVMRQEKGMSDDTESPVLLFMRCDKCTRVVEQTLPRAEFEISKGIFKSDTNGVIDGIVTNCGLRVMPLLCYECISDEALSSGNYLTMHP